ncbi:F-box/LRR-repeat protein 12-like [Lineus longissimus]|uniref:F-box/LRR-repeat protein 12-like n=1 Tax=Lineus longissimus TaxID=88925 RepID=UPI002B4D6FD5
MMDYPLPLAKMWRVIRAHFSDVLQTLRLSGFLAIGCATKWKRATISNAMLDELRERCPNITELCLSHTNLNTSKGVESKRFPPKLKVLKIQHSQVPCCMTWLSGGKEGSLLPELQELDFSNSSAVNVHTLTAFGPRDNLKVLRLNGCYRLTGSLYENLFDNFPNLVILEIAETSVSDTMLHQMCRKLTNLRHLHMAQSRQVTDAGIHCMSEGLKNLRWLNLAHCHKVTFEGFRGLAKLNLAYLSVAGNQLTENELKILEGAFKNCEVVHTDPHDNSSDGGSEEG